MDLGHKGEHNLRVEMVECTIMEVAPPVPLLQVMEVLVLVVMVLATVHVVVMEQVAAVAGMAAAECKSMGPVAVQDT
jgi:hypothetical protein